MFFTRLALIVAVGVLALGALQIAIALAVTQGMMGSVDEAMSRYHMANPGHAIDRGAYIILISIALGALADIRLAVQKLLPSKTGPL